jgi:hypothetical protein
MGKIMRTKSILALVLAALATTGAPAQDVPLDTLEGIVRAVRPSAVRVEITLRYDRGEAPRGIWAGNLVSLSADDGGTYVTEERPKEEPGFLVEERRAIVMDPMIHPRFVERIVVRQGEATVGARIESYTVEGHAMVLLLDEPLPDAKPLAFDAALPRPWYVVSAGIDEGNPYLIAGPLWPRVGMSEDEKKGVLLAGNFQLVVDASGKPVGLSLGTQEPADGAWRGSPLARPLLKLEDLKTELAALENRVAHGVVRVRLNFRSPKQDGRSRFSFSRSEGDTATEMNVAGVLLPDGLALVLTDLQPKDTFRLEKITIHQPAGESAEATFESSMRYYGAFLARLSRPLGGNVTLSTLPIGKHGGKMLLGAQIRLQGESRTTYVQGCGFTSVRLGWRRRHSPQITGQSGSLFLFDREGKLVAFPLGMRERLSEDRSWRRRSYGRMVASESLLKALADPDERVDPANVPSAEQEERRLAWLGVVLQPLGQELARASGVAHLTSDGETGAIVSFVYPDSPAAKAGIESGDVLLRIHAEGHPAPLAVNAQSGRFGGIPLSSNMPPSMRRRFGMGATPWPSADNGLTRMLTDLGEGTKCSVELFHDGEVLRKPFVVTLGPPHHGAAARVKHKGLELSVRDLTYEVRRYFQLKPEDPGVIVTKVEEGGKAAVAGIGIFEIVTHVDDKPVADVKAFEAALEGGGEKRISLKFKTRTRIVKVVLPENAEEKPEK